MGHLSSPARLIRISVAVVLVFAALGCGGDDGTDAEADPSSTSSAESPASEAAEPFAGYDGYESQQYDGTTNWICHPGLETDECRDIATTEVRADGTTEAKAVEPADDPPIDCFYAYPTTSGDTGPNADFDVDATEIDTVRAQAAPYGTSCRVFAPAYRQIPMVGLGTADAGARQLAYDDVLDAFKTYLTQQNEGRGFVLIGHSQGAGILKRIIAAEVDPEPELRRLLVSALLLGSGVTVPEGADVGGDFKEIPACTEAGQTGCVISLMAFPADQPPSAEGGSFFGRADGEGLQAMCVNPAQLAGGDDVADPIMYNKDSLVGSAGPYDGIDTPFVSLPGAVKTQCVKDGPLSFLAVSPAGAAGETRDTARLLTQRLGPTWGLHLVDANLPLGDLLQIVEAQSEAFTG